MNSTVSVQIADELYQTYVFARKIMSPTLSAPEICFNNTYYYSHFLKLQITPESCSQNPSFFSVLVHGLCVLPWLNNGFDWVLLGALAMPCHGAGCRDSAAVGFVLGWGYR